MEDREALLREMQEEYSNFKMLIDNVGWDRLMIVAEKQIENRMPSALDKTESLLSILTNEYEKGEIAGIRLFMQLPGIAIEQIKADIEKIERELGYERAERTSDGTDGDGADFEPAI
ncbi:MAG: hypothetical protein JSW47_08235 [Phycisphaerales bacterium]|nr:MAG: hypothetical protein JSW47_08235 [Phycisphaerales bacterium]